MVKKQRKHARKPPNQANQKSKSSSPSISLLKKAKNYLNKGIPYSETAKKLGIAKTTLYRNFKVYQREGCIPTASGRPRYFSDDFEKELSRTVKVYADYGNRITYSAIRNIAKDLCRTKFEKSRLTEKWARNFVSRRSESFKMRMRTASPAATKDRAGPYKEDKVVFLNTLRSLSPTIKSALEAGRFANTDEVQPCDKPTRRKILHFSSKSPKIFGLKDKDEKHVTALFLVSPDDAVMKQFRAPLLVLPKGVDMRDVKYGRVDAIANEVVYFGTESGWSNKQTWRLLAMEFCSKIKAAHPDLSRDKVFVLFIDCALSHIDKEALQMFDNHHIEIIFFPARSTSILQWLDTHFHGPMQKKIRKYIGEQYDDMRGNMANDKEKVQKMLNALAAAADEVFTPNKILKAFEETGFYPKLDLAKIADLLDHDDDAEGKETVDSIGISVHYSDSLTERFDEIFHKIAVDPTEELSVRPGALKDPSLSRTLVPNLIGFAIRNEKHVLPKFAEYLVYIKDHPEIYNQPVYDEIGSKVVAPPPMVMAPMKTRPETPTIVRRRKGMAVLASGRLGTAVFNILDEKEKEEAQKAQEIEENKKRKAEEALKKKEDKERRVHVVNSKHQIVRDLLIEVGWLNANGENAFPKITKEQHLKPLAKILGMKLRKLKFDEIIEELTKIIETQGHDKIVELVKKYEESEFITP